MQATSFCDVERPTVEERDAGFEVRRVDQPAPRMDGSATPGKQRPNLAVGGQFAHRVVLHSAAGEKHLIHRPSIVIRHLCSDREIDQASVGSFMIDARITQRNGRKPIAHAPHPLMTESRSMVMPHLLAPTWHLQAVSVQSQSSNGSTLQSP